MTVTVDLWTTCPRCGAEREDGLVVQREDDTIVCGDCGLLWDPERETVLEAVPFQWLERPLSEVLTEART